MTERVIQLKSHQRKLNRLNLDQFIQVVSSRNVSGLGTTLNMSHVLNLIRLPNQDSNYHMEMSRFAISQLTKRSEKCLSWSRSLCSWFDCSIRHFKVHWFLKLGFSDVIMDTNDKSSTFWMFLSHEACLPGSTGTSKGSAINANLCPVGVCCSGWMNRMPWKSNRLHEKIKYFSRVALYDSREK